MRMRTPSSDALAVRRAREAFTMVEVALSLAIVAFALVAIIGVLPTGMKVQKENREETVVNQDGMFWLEAIRSGSKGMDELTNYVETISVNWGSVGGPLNNQETYSPGPSGQGTLTRGSEVIGLLSIPRYDQLVDGSFRENRVVAQLRALAGSASEKSRTNETAFRYQMQVEIAPFNLLPTNLVTSTSHEELIAANLHRGLYEVRITMRWPVYEVRNEQRVGRYRKTFRTLVNGELQQVDPVLPYFFFVPNSYSSAF